MLLPSPKKLRRGQEAGYLIIRRKSIMKKKTGIIVTSVMSIACCASLITGATFALFTSESKVNIAVTSGKVDVKATIDETSVETYSGQWNETTKVYDSVKQAEGAFSSTAARP